MPSRPWLQTEDDSSDETDYREMAQQAVEGHLEAVQTYSEAVEDHGWHAEADLSEYGLPTESTSYGTYCGCRRCDVREMLWTAWPYSQLEAVQWASEAVRERGDNELADFLTQEASRLVGGEMLRVREADNALLASVADFYDTHTAE